MNPSRPGHRRKAGFTLLEILISSLLGSLLLVVLFAGLLSLQRTLLSRPVRIGAEDLPVAPAFAVFPEALRLEECLISHLASARATYVLGGAYPGSPEVSESLRTRPLRAASLPGLEGCPGGLPRDSAAFYQRYANLLGDVETSPGENDFSILVVGPYEGALALTCLVQVRSSELLRAGDEASWRRLSVSLVDIRGVRHAYAFIDRASSKGESLAGASHLWLRLDEADGVAEEGPACVVLPDPWRFPGAAGFSRFTHFLPVSL